MPQITDLNVAPYYDDFDEDDNFHRVLFRPFYNTSKRTNNFTIHTSKSQVEKHGKHMFVEGSVVIPVKYLIQIKLQLFNLHQTLLVKL